MESSSLLSTITAELPSVSPAAVLAQLDSASDPVPAHHANPVVGFIIGLAIVILASILNAAGLNLTKLDHVRTSSIPKAARRRDWLRPLWLLGMILYILSQLIGSTLALEYMRAEYVAPLGSTSLIFNFLFAKFLIGSPVTNNDIYGTVIVIIGVIGIVAFGSINSGLGSETDASHLTYLWTRGNWLAFFFFMAFALILLYFFTSELEVVLNSRSDLSAVPFADMAARRAALPATSYLAKVKSAWSGVTLWCESGLEAWTAPHDDTRIAWTLGIGWACCGGGLAGGTLVFAKAAVKLITGSLSHENTGNQFGHASVIFTFILLAVTAVAQIICLNRGLKVYDSTLVVPVFYGVYTALGFLDSLIFNDEVDAYQSWALFLIFVSILILISGVVLLTHKKPDAHHEPGANGVPLRALSPRPRAKRAGKKGGSDGDEEEALHEQEEGGADVVWQLGDASDDDDDGHHGPPSVERRVVAGTGSKDGVGERKRMMSDEEEEAPRRSASSDATLARPESGSFRDDFGPWNSAFDKEVP